MPQLEAIAAWWPALGLVPLLWGLWWVYRLAGWRGVVVVLTLGIAGWLYRKGGADKQAQMERERELQRSKAIAERKAVDHEVSEMDDDTVSRDLSKWLRDN